MSGNWRSNRMQRNKSTEIESNIQSNDQMGKSGNKAIHSEKMRFKNADELYK